METVKKYFGYYQEELNKFDVEQAGPAQIASTFEQAKATANYQREGLVWYEFDMEKTSGAKSNPKKLGTLEGT